MKNFLMWLGSVFAGHVVLQLVFTIPFSYLASLVYQLYTGAEVTFDSIPPIFFLILAVASLLILFWPAFGVPIRTWLRKPSYQSSRVNEAYQFLVKARDAILLNDTINFDKYQHYAQDRIDPLMPLLKKLAKKHSLVLPTVIQDEPQDTYSTWYRFFRELRSKMGE